MQFFCGGLLLSAIYRGKDIRRIRSNLRQGGGKRMITSNKEFQEQFKHLLQMAVDSDGFCNLHKNTTFRDIDRLYMGTVVGVSGYFPPIRAIQNLKQSFVILNIPITRDIALSFRECLEYAESKLNNYSLMPWGYGKPIISIPFVFPNRR